MNISTVQRLLATTNSYNSGIDGIAGGKTMAAVTNIIGASNWSQKRQLIAAAQHILNALGYEAGSVDGYEGHNTKNALAAWDYKNQYGEKEIIDRTPMRPQSPAANPLANPLPRQNDVATYYGQPGAQIKSRLATVALPYSLRIDYNLRQKATKVTLHKKCVTPFIAAMVEVKEHYGLSRMIALGIDRYAGGFNHRKMRGGSSWSMHAYGCAVDFFARPNGLRMRCPEALFCGSDYKAFLDIMESHGWLSALRLWGADAMHFQMARL